MEETKVANGDAGFHSVNSMQDIGGSLDPIAMAFGADKDIVTKLTEAVEQLKKHNASLTTQIIDAININLEIAKNLILKATKGKYHEVKILADKANINAAFERILDPDGYFWT